MVSVANPNAGPVTVKVAPFKLTDTGKSTPAAPKINLYQCGEWHGVYSQSQLYGKLEAEADKELYDYYNCAKLGAAKPPKKPDHSSFGFGMIVVLGLLILGAGGIYYIYRRNRESF